MQHDLDWLGRYLDKKGIDLIVLYQLSVKESVRYLRLSPFQRKCFNGIYCSCLSDFTYKELLLIVDNVKIKFTKMDRLFFTNLDRII